MNRSGKNKKTATKERTLTIKQQKALDAILSGTATSWTQAAQIAGYKGNNNTLRQRAHNLVTNGNIQKAIDNKRAIIAEKVEESAESIAKVFQDLRQKAIETNNIAEARQNNIELAKHLGFYERDNRQKAGFQPIQVNFNTDKATRPLIASTINDKVEPIPTHGSSGDCSAAGMQGGSGREGEAPQELMGDSKAVYDKLTHADTSIIDAYCNKKSPIGQEKEVV